MNKKHPRTFGLKLKKPIKQCRADTLHDAIMDAINAAAKNGASVVEIMGAINAASVRVQGRAYDYFRQEAERKEGQCG